MQNGITLMGGGWQYVAKLKPSDPAVTIKILSLSKDMLAKRYKEL